MQKLIIVLSLFFLATLKLSAQQPEIFSVSGKAIGGYDAVAYFTEGKATQGDSQFIHSWRGADWQFISAGNLNAFKKILKNMHRNSVDIAHMVCQKVIKRLQKKMHGQL